MFMQRGLYSSMGCIEESTPSSSFSAPGSFVKLIGIEFFFFQLSQKKEREK
jgi:hypothetical protein